ncbi:3952_t:CDS:2, partial [Entrophospora sp. SA101]
EENKENDRSWKEKELELEVEQLKRKLKNLEDHHETQHEKKCKVDNTWDLTREEADKIKRIPPPSNFCKEYNPDYIFNFCPNYTNIPVALYHPVF